MICPRLNCKSTRMCKAGMIWSGKHKVQRYRCLACGSTTTIPILEKSDNISQDITEQG